MFDLVKKDLKIGWIFLLVMTAVIPFITLLSLLTMIEEFGGLVLGFFIPMTIILCVGSAFIFIGIDEVYNADFLYASLPIGKSKIVCARYFSSFLMVILSFGLIFLTSFAFINLFQKTDPVLMLFVSFRGLFATILFLMIILIFNLPFVFKFGTSKGISVAIFTQIGLFLLVQIFKFILRAIKGILSFDLALLTGLFDSIRKWVTGLRTDETYIFIFAVLVVLTLISIGLSTRILRNKDI